MAPASGLRTRWELWILCVVCVAGLTVRLLYLQEVRQVPEFKILQVDALYYDYWARGLVTGDWTPPAGSLDPEIPARPFLQPPGYPYFLALIYKTVGVGRWAPAWIQLILGLVNVLLAYRFARRWYGAAAGLLTAGAMALYWPLIYYEKELLDPVVVTSLVLVTLGLMGKWSAKPALPRAVWPGVALGLCVLIRPNLVLCVPGIVAWMGWIIHRRQGRLKALGPTAACFLLVFAATVLPATIRNMIVAHDPVILCANGGLNLYLGNNEAADGITAGSSALGAWTHFDYPSLVRRLAQEEGRALDYSGASAVYTRRALDYVVRHPGPTLRLLLRKTELFWGPAEVANITTGESLERRESRILRYVPGSFAWVFALAILGVLQIMSEFWRAGGRSAARAGRVEIAVLMVMFSLICFLSYLPFLVAGRFRLPVVPILFILAAVGVVAVWRAFVAKRFRTAGAWVLAGIVFYALVSQNFAGYEPNRADFYFFRGYALENEGRIDEAMRQYEQALALDPQHARAHNNLGKNLADLGRSQEAVHHFQQAVAASPADWLARRNLGVALVALGRPEEAVALFRQALALCPDEVALLDDLGAALMLTGQPDEAWSRFERALQLRPGSTKSHIGAALALNSLGRFRESLPHLQDALRLNPDDVQVREWLDETLKKLGPP